MRWKSVLQSGLLSSQWRIRHCSGHREELSQLTHKLAQEKLYLEDEIRTDANFKEIIGKSAELRRVLKLVETVAPTDSTVLIYGETGTGKELIARAIHNLSPRQPRAFVKLNCSAIPTGLLAKDPIEKSVSSRRETAAGTSALQRIGLPGGMRLQASGQRALNRKCILDVESAEGMGANDLQGKSHTGLPFLDVAKRCGRSSVDRKFPSTFTNQTRAEPYL